MKIRKYINGKRTTDNKIKNEKLMTPEIETAIIEARKRAEALNVENIKFISDGKDYDING